MTKKSSNNKGFTKTDLKNIREKLIQEKAKILEEILNIKGQSLNKSFKDASGDLSGYSFHMADMATDQYDREFSLELAQSERERLYELDAAIKSIDEGRYGKCEECSKHISKQRLKAMPQASLCIECQEEAEKEEKAAGK